MYRHLASMLRVLPVLLHRNGTVEAMGGEFSEIAKKVLIEDPEH